MITPTLSKTVLLEKSQPTASTALPSFVHLIGAACTVSALPFALLLIVGRAALAGSFALGVTLSLGICGLLFLFVEHMMPLLIIRARGRAVTAGSSQGSQFQFLLLLGAKLAVIALIGAAFLTLHHINPIAVLTGFMLGQSTIIITALRFRKSN